MTSPRRGHLMFTALSGLLIMGITTARPLIQIEGQLKEIKANPSWFILLRNVDTGSIVPWMLDLQGPFVHWSVFPEGHDYQIIASEMRFNDNTVLHNVCDIEDGIVSGRSLQITLKGQLTPTSDTFDCRKMSWSDS